MTSAQSPAPCLRNMSRLLEEAHAVRGRIERLEVDIYAPLIAYPEAVYTTGQLEALLEDELVGKKFDAAANKTRTYLAKRATAIALGYDCPKSFRRGIGFSGQDLEIKTQKNRNVQVYNGVVNPARRYVLFGVAPDNIVLTVNVLEGAELAAFDKTGTVTSKYQARRAGGKSGSALTCAGDTPTFQAELSPVGRLGSAVVRRLHTSARPTPGEVLTVSSLHRKLLRLVDMELVYSESERRRGEQLHRAVCKLLGLDYADRGNFPDIPCQALEVKLQLEATIDLGMVMPNSEEPVVNLFPGLRHCDVRYLVAYGSHDSRVVRIEEIVITTGQSFFEEFTRCGGRGRNDKLQIHLPKALLHTKKA